MKTDELRALFLSFFEEHGHTVYPGDSLVPSHDPSLLFTGAGMNQFKDMFLGRGKLPFKKAATVQRCLRTGDIENVGVTASHHTFFEMLGNFSFGDYFKKEAIVWAWELVTERLKLPPEKLSVSIYEDDEEALAVWHGDVGIEEGEIYRFGEHDNFWPADAPSLAPAGTLCGPCTEIFYDRGKGIGCGRPECGPDCDCDRYVEIWNLVFQQFEKGDSPGELHPLSTRNIDTGMGLERLASVIQHTATNFEIDIFLPLVSATCEAAGRTYGSENETDRSARRIADHVRAAAFAIADGVFPSNEGRGYVIRRLLRRAVLDCRRLGIDEPFLYSLVPLVVSLMDQAYPMLREREGNIGSFIRSEEENFRTTIETGLSQLDRFASGLESGQTLPGKDVFTLHDTYGFPPEVTAEVLAERGIETDMEGFKQEMEAARRRSRSGTSMSEDMFGHAYMQELKDVTKGTEFAGYESLECDARVVAIVRGEGENARLVQSASAEDGEIRVVLDRTAFYGESGGQRGDSGIISFDGGKFGVSDTARTDGIFFHRGQVSEAGAISTGLSVRCMVHSDKRKDIARNHTATHLLHHFLRAVLGKHVEQSGSLVDENRLRLDFTHHSAVTRQEMDEVETQVNLAALADSIVETKQTSVEDAKKEGAIALFGEKYGDAVRLVNIGGYSKELCAGTHVSRTGEIGLFRIVREESVAAGVRRIEAITGRAALESVKALEREVAEASRAVKAQPGELAARVSALRERTRSLEKELKKARLHALTAGQPSQGDDPLQHVEIIGDVKLLALNLGEATIEDVRATGDTLKKKLGESVIILAAHSKGRANVVCIIGRETAAAKGLKAGEIVKKAAAVLGGGGGGRDTMAQGGGTKVDAIAEALKAASDAVRQGLT